MHSCRPIPVGLCRAFHRESSAAYSLDRNSLRVCVQPAGPAGPLPKVSRDTQPPPPPISVRSALEHAADGAVLGGGVLWVLMWRDGPAGVLADR